MPFGLSTAGIYYPVPPSSVIAYAQAILLDSANESAAALITIGASGTVSKIGFRVATVTTGATLDVRLETLNAAGNPSDTLYQSSSNALFKVVEANSQSYITATLGSGTLVQQGSILGVRIQMSATSAGNLTINRVGNLFTSAFPGSDAFTGNSWSKNSNWLVAGLEYSDGTYPHIDGILPVSTINTIVYNTNSSPDERGNLFIFPFPQTVYGCWYDNTAVAPDPADFILYDSDGTTVTETIFVNSALSNGQNVNYYYLKNTARFVQSGTYRLTIVTRSLSSNVSMYEAVASNTAIYNSFFGAPFMSSTYRTDSGTWVNSTNAFHGVGLLLSGFDTVTSNVVAQMGGVWGF